MEIDYKTMFAGIAVVISALSYQKARRSLKLSEEQHEENKNLNIRKALSEQYKEYVDIYNNEFHKHNQMMSDLSTIINKTNSRIGDIFDFYDNKFRTEYNDRMYARHIYNEVHELISKSFQEELSWQTPENIKFRLNYYRNINVESLESKNQNKVSHYDQTIQNNMYTLDQLVDKTKKKEFFNDVMQKILEVKNFFKNHEETVKSSIVVLERGLAKNKLEEFKLQENYELYRFYIQLLYLLRHIKKSSINYISDKDFQYLYTGKLVAYGADLSMINDLILNVSSFTYER
jgi:hypothetical protein